MTPNFSPRADWWMRSIMLGCFVVVLLILGGICFVAPPRSSDWPQFLVVFLIFVIPMLVIFAGHQNYHLDSEGLHRCSWISRESFKFAQIQSLKIRWTSGRNGKFATLQVGTSQRKPPMEIDFTSLARGEGEQLLRHLHAAAPHAILNEDARKMLE